MPGFYGEINDWSGEPAEGTVTLTPSAPRAMDDGFGVLGGGRKTLVLEDGEFDVDIESGNYRIDIRLIGADTFSREIRIPEDVDSVSLKDALTDYLEVES